MTMAENFIVRTLATAFGAAWDLFWPVLLPLFGLLALAFVAYLVRTFTNVG